MCRYPGLAAADPASKGLLLGLGGDGGALHAAVGRRDRVAAAQGRAMGGTRGGRDCHRGPSNAYINPTTRI